jgi:hypothetical protein
MAFTFSQYRRFQDHANLVWLREKAARNQAIHQDTIKSKISEAIRSVPEFANRVTDDNISWVADQVRTPWGNVYTPPAVTSGSAHVAAVTEISGSDPDMAQAVRMVFERTAGGRSAPGTTHVNHIHVGGHGTLNLLFDTTTYTVLGIVNGHMDGAMSPAVQNQAQRVTARLGGNTVQMNIQGNTVEQSAAT